MSKGIAPSLTQFSDGLAGLVADASRAVVGIEGARHWPLSGLHWRPGLVVTAEEAIERDEGITVVLPDGRSGSAVVAGRDPTTDIALLRIAAEGVSTVAKGDAAGLRAGHLVLAVGRHETGPVASLGIAAVAGAAWQSRRGGTIDRLIRLDLDLSPAGEGGALIDMGGAVLGMTVPGPRRRTLAIPASTIDRIVDQLLEKGYIARGYLGAGLTPVRQGAGAGVLVTSLDDQGPAARAGLLIGDIVTAWGGEAVGNMRGVLRRLTPESVGRTVDLGLTRGGTPLTLTVAIGERPRPER